MLPHWRLAAYYFFYFAFIGAFAPYFSLYLQSLAFSAWDIGVLMSLMQVTRIVAPAVWGWLADRVGAKTPVVRAAAALSMAGFAGFFATREFPGVFAAMAALAFFWSAALPLVEAMTLGHLGAAVNRYGRIRLWGSIGFIAAVLGVGYLLDRMPIGTILWVCQALLGGILLCSLLVPEAAPLRHDADQLSLGAILRRTEVLRLLGACFLMAAAHGPLYVFLSIYLVGHDYSKAAVGSLWTLGVVIEIGVFMYMPRLLRTFSLHGILRFSFACAVVRFLVIGWAVEFPGAVVFAQMLHGATFGAYHAAAVAAVSQWFGGRHQARGQALYAGVSFGGGGMVGGLVSGYAWEVLGPALTYTLGSSFALLGFLLLGGRSRASSPPPAAR